MVRRFIKISSIAVVVLLVVFACDAFAQSGVSVDTVGKIVSAFTEKSNAWGTALQQYAFGLFKLCTTLTIAMFGVKAVLNRHQLGEVLGQFVMTLVFCGFVLAVINYYQEWSGNIITGLKNIAGELGPSNLQIDKPLEVGYKMAATIFKKLSVFSPGESVGYVIAALVVMITFALITAQVVLIKCEAAIVMNAAMILLGLGGASFLKEYAINVMRYVLSVAFKLFVMQLVLGLGLQFIQDMVVSEANFEDIIIIIGVSVVLFALVKSLPDAIAGVISGSNVSGGSALSQAGAALAGGAVGAAATAIGMGAGSYGASQAVKKAAQTAGMSGASGVGKVGEFGKALLGAHMDARFDRRRAGHFTSMNANAGKRLQEMKMRNMASGNEEES
ncbi:P-type conjugative transfer protein TrbL [Desulfovibrio sp. TomC]|uniref:P-type conjugative transfer protein TrbL n=1 Tax=Desulfovibrio sp. TomC TaxID=1562888 RepID=UPI000574FBD8|nr:P-type conjugative transfer protein TrbL [Desulfovibrio sp. TomC]KHK00251.1 Conjugative transfer protein TrbL [Desulfovibrio sp. TomC]